MKNLQIGIIILISFYFGKTYNYAIEKNFNNTEIDNSSDQIKNNEDNLKYLNSVLNVNSTISDNRYSCDSEIFCHGKLLHTVSLAKIFKDSKTFVDMSLKFPPEKVLANFDSFMENRSNPNTEEVREFVNQNFNEKGFELEVWIPTDWKENPKFLESVKNDALRQWGKELNDIWKILGRKMKPEVENNPYLYSIIPVKNPVIVPGGRFLEFYYWDSYWVIKGLLICEMYTTVEGILDNFLSIIYRFGFIPNGGRIYYLNRSQPPLLAPMIKSYVDITNNTDFAIRNVNLLEKEFNYFWDNYCHDINGHKLCSYFAKSLGPRPESYREDYELAKNLQSEEEKNELYANIKAAAESGMDFSGRWFITENGTNDGNLTNTKARYIIAVDLNAYLYQNAKIISNFYALAKNSLKSEEFAKIADEIAKSIDAILWNDTIGSWLDYDLINKKQRNYFVPTNLSPLWVKSFNVSDKENISKKILKYLNETGVDKYPGGVPNTIRNTGEQWDLPNVWPPMQHLLIIGLDNLNTTESKALAEKWATRWVQSNYAAYLDNKHMYEKYDANKFGGHGGGGEYDVQVGFGWSNGVIIDLLTKYGDKLKPHNSGNSLLKGGSTGLIVFLFAVLTRLFQ
ncbi:trehalase-like [Condylostylus longicornis]|uniref:trehalase-like n=1 Tax=Condylostylus longicornis TaxID=2530218 RepID=UPI00244DBA03|nr:trehalase-like [Condylostylus longicornis]